MDSNGGQEGEAAGPAQAPPQQAAQGLATSFYILLYFVVVLFGFVVCGSSLCVVLLWFGGWLVFAGLRPVASDGVSPRRVCSGFFHDSGRGSPILILVCTILYLLLASPMLGWVSPVWYGALPQFLSWLHDFISNL